MPENAMSRSFRIFAQLGFDVSIRFVHSVLHKKREIEISHVTYDGINGFVKILRDENALLPDSYPPLRKEVEEPFLSKWLNRFKQYFRTVGQFSRPSRKWLLSKPALPSGQFPSASHMCTLEESQQLRKIAHSNACSLNVYFLYCLNRTLFPYLESASLPCAWIVPAMLYSDWKQADETGVLTSIMELNLGESDTPSTIQEKLTFEVQQKSYWGPFLGAMINDFMPDFLNRAILKSTVARKMRVGTLSNLGRWKGKETDKSESWTVLPCVHPGQPFGMGVIEFNDKLGFGVKVDPCLGLQEEDLVQILKKWLDILFEKKNEVTQ